VAIYIIAICAVVLLLIVAYRALGAPRRARDPAVLLRSLHSELSASVDDLDAWQPQAHSAGPAGDDSARSGRRRSAAVQQTLDLLGPSSELDDVSASARALLAAAAEDTAWAWRIVQAYGESQGLLSAVAALRDHAADCCDEAARLLASAPGGEPADRM
jgi:hypothetical protein